MFILNQSGDEIINTEQMILCRISYVKANGEERYCINAHMRDIDTYISIAVYPTMEQAKGALLNILNKRYMQYETVTMPNAEEKS